MPQRNGANNRLKLTARLFLAERPQLKRSVSWIYNSLKKLELTGRSL
jgi:hypothetical protein